MEFRHYTDILLFLSVNHVTNYIYIFSWLLSCLVTPTFGEVIEEGRYKEGEDIASTSRSSRDGWSIGDVRSDPLSWPPQRSLLSHPR